MSDEPTERCDDLSPSIGGAPRELCRLRPGHAGWHTNGGSRWTHEDRLNKVSPTTADGLLRLSLAIERLAGAIERHR